ncbi:MAG: bifunctional GNAT family N-acetyltransferase/carbon-nitrogen hydrolase family protein [Candidatus Krumholzibacteriia bacterium]
MDHLDDNGMKVIVRALGPGDYEDLHAVMLRAYPEVDDDPWARREVMELLRRFPEGQVAVEVNGRLVACALSLIVDYARFGDNHTYAQITGDGTFSTYDPDGDVLYGIEVFVDPDFRGLRLARRLYDVRKELCEKYNLRAIVVGGRIPGYAAHADTLAPREYIHKVRLRELYDPILTFQLSNGFHVKKVLQGYLAGDHESLEHATLLEWNNIYHQEKPRALYGEKREVRIGVIQWQMRAARSIDAIVEQAEYFIDTLSDYRADFILLPELFNAPLLVNYNEVSQARAMRRLAETTGPILERMREFAVSYNVNIVAGSMPVLVGRRLHNVAHLCRRDGSVEAVSKLHITPSEREYFGMSGGSAIKALDTDCGRIGILICYDVEFPELPRLLRSQGAEILFVPYMTDTQTAYQRVRFCAHARAVENECYVAITGCVGNLPRVDNMDIQYSRSAVFSPSDFAFPSTGIMAEATPNTEMVLIADVDLDLLKQLSDQGSVHNWRDRRDDLYQLKARRKAAPPGERGPGRP